MNDVTLAGNLGKDPESINAGGTPLLKFSLATNDGYMGKDGEWVDKASWHNIEVWGKRAESLAGVLRKGSWLILKGSINYDSFDGKDGQKVYMTKIKAHRVELGGKAQRETQQQGFDKPDTGDSFGDSDDLPF